MDFELDLDSSFDWGFNWFNSSLYGGAIGCEYSTPEISNIFLDNQSYLKFGIDYF